MSARTEEAVSSRYAWLAPLYDHAIGEHLFYARARRRTIELLRLAPGATVLDVACGTGLNFPLIEERIGPSGNIVGVDLSEGMLRRARARVQTSGWTNVCLVEMDAASLTRARLEANGALPASAPADAALCTLGLSVVPRWEAAWKAMLGVVRPGGTVAVMDGGDAPGRAAADEVGVLRPFVWMMCRLAAADCTRRPWRRAERELDRVETGRFTWGYMRVAAGTKTDGSVR
jgi:demethylmenaquinone methyltransferase/2-methoxy-6-polyprenyl-1,4-benzoquinol methylase